jgi:hypothetical protein
VLADHMPLIRPEPERPCDREHVILDGSPI